MVGLRLLKGGLQEYQYLLLCLQGGLMEYQDLLLCLQGGLQESKPIFLYLLLRELLKVGPSDC